MATQDQIVKMHGYINTYCTSSDFEERGVAYVGMSVLLDDYKVKNKKIGIVGTADDFAFDPEYFPQYNSRLTPLALLTILQSSHTDNTLAINLMKKYGAVEAPVSHAQHIDSGMAIPSATPAKTDNSRQVTVFVWTVLALLLLAAAIAMIHLMTQAKAYASFVLYTAGAVLGVFGFFASVSGARAANNPSTRDQVMVLTPPHVHQQPSQLQSATNTNAVNITNNTNSNYTPGYSNLNNNVQSNHAAQLRESFYDTMPVGQDYPSNSH